MDEEKEEQELDELLDFADALDIDGYLGDYEVRTALVKVEQRIAALDAEEASERAHQRGGGGGEDADDDDAATVASMDLEEARQRGLDLADLVSAGVQGVGVTATVVAVSFVIPPLGARPPA